MAGARGARHEDTLTPSSVSHQIGPSGRLVIGLLIAWLAAYFAVRLTLDVNPNMASRVRLALAFSPTPIFALFLWQFLRRIRAADELERRIQLEAFGFAFLLGFVLLTTLGLVQRAVELSVQDWSYNHVWPMFAVFYIAGVLAARRRYS